MRRQTRPSGRDADPRRTIPLQSARWQKLRAYVLARDPLCRDCGAIATDLDPASPQELGRRMQQDHELWLGLMKAAGIQPE